MRSTPPRTPALLAVVIALAALAAGQAQAKCASRSVSLWPSPQHTLPPTPLFAVTGYGLDRDLIVHAGERIRLVDAEGEAHPLKVVALHPEGYRTRQVLLRPVEPLKVGARYRLQVRREDQLWDDKADKIKTRLNPFGDLTVWSGGEQRQAAWVVKAPASSEAPRWRAEPEDQTIHVRHFGCGPAMGPGDGGQGMPVALEASPGAAMRVKLIPEGGGEAQEALVPLSDEGTIAIGHGMCSGAFTLDPNGRYEVTLTPTNLSGQAGEARQIRYTP